MERVILTTGGTGGHIFPALAIAEEIRGRWPKAMILFMGGQYGQEADIAVKAGLDFVGLPVRGVMGRGLRGIPAAIGMGRGVLRALGIIRKTRPDLVVGFGGYAAFAGVLAGRLSGTVTAVHEQNSFPGMTNRLLGRWVDRVFLSMPDRSGVFSQDKTVLVGNPVRAGIAALYEKGARFETPASAPAGKSYYGGVDGPSPFDVKDGKREDAAPVPEEPATEEPAQARAPRLLVMGGSQGARAINDGMIAAILPLLEAGVEIWHQCGQADFERVRAAYRDAKAEHVRVEPFIVDMPRAYEWADLIFCRAGASTLAEITAAGLPSVLAPFPQAAQNHQFYNARFLEEEEAAVVLEQSRFTGPGSDASLPARLLLELLQDKARRHEMSVRSFRLARPYAARDLVNELEILLQNRK